MFVEARTNVSVTGRSAGGASVSGNRESGSRGGSGMEAVVEDPIAGWGWGGVGDGANGVVPLGADPIPQWAQDEKLSAGDMLPLPVDDDALGHLPVDSKTKGSSSTSRSPGGRMAPVALWCRSAMRDNSGGAIGSSSSF